jgi:hypothetical protein
MKDKNIIRYKLEDSFGPILAIIGKIISIVNAVTLIYFLIKYFRCLPSLLANEDILIDFLTCLLWCIVCAFCGFSKSEIFIDKINIKIRFSNTFFGFIRNGKWVNIDDNMEVGIRRNLEKWSITGRSNKSIPVKSLGYKIVLYKSDKPFLTLKYATTKEEADEMLNAFAELFKMG